MAYLPEYRAVKGYDVQFDVEDLGIVAYSGGMEIGYVYVNKMTNLVYVHENDLYPDEIQELLYDRALAAGIDWETQE